MATGPDILAALADLIAYQREMGVEDALDEAPVDRFMPLEPAPVAPAPAVAAPSAPVSPVAPRAPAAPMGATAQPAPVAPDVAIEDARALAARAKTLDELRDLMRDFEGCALKRTARRLVFADGNPQARVMLVGEAPGQEEDARGLPFVGRSGQLLDRMLAAIGLDRDKVYIANVVPWRPPGNRTPTPQETAICLPFIRRQIALVDPDILVTLGSPASQALFETKDGIFKVRGVWRRFHTGTRDIDAMATLHPAYLLRTPAQKARAWRDFKAIRKALVPTLH